MCVCEKERTSVFFRQGGKGIVELKKEEEEEGGENEDEGDSLGSARRFIMRPLSGCD